MKNTPENAVKVSVRQLLEYDGWFVQSNPNYGPYCTKGRPDLEAYKDGKVLLIECKSATGKLRPDQIKYRDKVSRFAVYIVARSVDDIKQYLTTVQALW